MTADAAELRERPSAVDRPRPGSRRWRAVPGLAVAGAIAVAAAAAGPWMPEFLSQVALAVLGGVAVANLLPWREQLRPGARVAVGVILKVGIVLLGARLAVGDVVAQGASAVGLVTVSTTVVLTIGLFVALRGPRPRLGLLIAAGCAICGNSAIVAMAPVVEADDREVSFAVATITGLGMLAVVIYPIVGQLLDLPSAAFGLWAGAAINDTSQVVAAGYAFDPTAGDIAVVTKLTRNLLLAPSLIAVGLLIARGRAATPVELVRRGLPIFVIGFLVMAIARSIGLLDVTIAGRPAADLASDAASAAILIALAGVGLQTDVRAVAAAGMRPVALALGLATGLAVGSLALILALGLGR